MAQTVYYTGIGAKKSGKHTVKEFLTRMKKLNANGKKTFTNCLSFKADLDYPPCKKYKEYEKKKLSAWLQDKPFFNKKINQTRKLRAACTRHKKTAKRKPCSLNDYIKYSGARIE
jgi:hypothetical protein